MKEISISEEFCFALALTLFLLKIISSSSRINDDDSNNNNSKGGKDNNRDLKDKDKETSVTKLVKVLSCCWNARRSIWKTVI